jgi:hypothetical protein
MTEWAFRLRGQFSRIGDTPYVDYIATEVRVGTAPDRPLVEVRMPNLRAPVATFELDSIFAYEAREGSTIRVWRRDPWSSGESVLVTPPANFAERGALDSIETIDLKHQQVDATPLGRVIAKWVSDFAPVPQRRS